jgi:hypothetical protein
MDVDLVVFGAIPPGTALILRQGDNHVPGPAHYSVISAEDHGRRLHAAEYVGQNIIEKTGFTLINTRQHVVPGWAGQDKVLMYDVVQLFCSSRANGGVKLIDNGFHGDDLKLLLALFALMVSTGAVDRGPGSVARPANRCQAAGA